MTFTIGVDVGGTKVLGGVVDEFGEVHKTARRDTPKKVVQHLPLQSLKLPMN